MAKTDGHRAGTWGQTPTPVGAEGLPPFQELQQWADSSLTGLPALRVTILRNVVLDSIVPYLRYLAWQDGLRAECRFGDYDAVMQETVGGAPDLLNASTDGVLVFLRLETLSPRLMFSYAELSAQTISEEVERIRETVTAMIAGIRRQTSAMILWHAFEQPVYPALGMLDGQWQHDGQTDAIHRLNTVLRKALGQARNGFLVDVNRCLARVGSNDFYDARYWHAARAPYTLKALREIAFENMKYLRALKGRAKKCLVLDCDGVLWGGTIGEDGLAGIKLGRTFPGSTYHEFQQEILNLHHRGVLLALCSKNNPADVWAVFEEHPDMVLKREHIAAARINWTDKASNLREIAHELNIGLDSLVMVDDTDFEVGLIREFAPEVRVLALPASRASHYRTALAACGLFDTLTLSAEDRTRGAAYQAEAARRQAQSASGDMDSFLRSLRMALDVHLTNDFTLPRVAQLTQKTNQFNLTTRRYSEEDIRRFVDGGSDVISLRYRDHFGDAGIVGVCVLVYNDAEAVIDTLLLSCRILGRGVERSFLAEVLKRAIARGATWAIGEYRPTPRNTQVQDFFVRQGFAPIAGDEGARFRLDLTRWVPPTDNLFTIETDITNG